MNGPANMTMIRFHGDRVQNCRSASCGSTSICDCALASSISPWNGPVRRLRPSVPPFAGGSIPIMRT